MKPGWGNLVEDFFDSSQGQGLISYVNNRKDEIGEDNVYPPDPLRALTLKSLDEVRVVII